MRKVERIFVHCTASNGVKGYNDTAIAMKIYNSNGDEEYSNKQAELISRCSELCIPAVMDGIQAAITKGRKKK